jgi:hypothetical protein
MKFCKQSSLAAFDLTAGKPRRPKERAPHFWEAIKDTQTD